MNAQPLTPDIVLSTGRTVVHSRMANGAQQAGIAGPDGPEMTNEEWIEYCQRIVTLNAK